MPYITNVARILTHELAKYAGHRRHQLAGHLANLDFWIAETRHCLSVIDAYAWRFERLNEAQTKFVLEHKVVEFEMDDPSRAKVPVTPPRKIPEADLMNARRGLCTAFYQFLIRCHNKGMIEEPALRKECDSLGIAVEAKDLKRR